MISKFRAKVLPTPTVDLEHKDMFRLAMEHSGIGMALIAKNGKWLKANQAICDILGYSENELLHIDFQTVTHPDDLQADLIFLTQLLAGDIQTYHMEKRYFHKDGQLIWVKLTVSLVRDDDDQPLYFISQIQDISEQKKASQALLSAKQEMEEFSYRITHDLRSPLSSMDYVMSMIANCIEDEEYQKALSTAKAAQTGITKLSDLVTSVLDVSKIKLQDEPVQSVDVSDMVYNALGALSHMKDFVRLDIETYFDYIGEINTKPLKFMQIVDNFLSNAIKYQDTTRANSFIKISTYSANNVFVFEVYDNGLGVDEQYRDKLFNMFERFHPKASYGTGLGLYMVKKSAEMLGGNVSYSTPDCAVGSIFRVSLPLNKRSLDGTIAR
ncbi:MAG: PAS domain S-box protein [Paraglaciecola polaris]|uniref:sensor histidine kinase n=2 Tax=Paraglaciecola polaris TaxID=222814 RepID=UPI0030028A53